jgi:hypothetical protein
MTETAPAPRNTAAALPVAVRRDTCKADDRGNWGDWRVTRWGHTFRLNFCYTCTECGLTRGDVEPLDADGLPIVEADRPAAIIRQRVTGGGVRLLDI